MAKNWVRDLALARGESTVRGYMPEKWLMAYHMLRCAGYSWIWECDGDRGVANAAVANHVPDGNMEGVIGNWSVAGSPTPAISKSTTTVYSGTQSLEITGESGGEVQSSVSTSTPQSRGTGVTLNTGGTITKQQTTRYDFCNRDVGETIVISGAAQPGNNGSFTISSVTDKDTLVVSPAPGTNEGAAGATWYIQRPMHLAIWVNNPGSQTWNVDVDRGDGTPVNVGSFAGTTGWEIKHFDFTGQSTGNLQVFIRPQGTSETIHIDGMLIFRSYFEFTNDFEDHVNGDTGAYVAQTVSNEFESTSYTFVTGDIGKIVFIFDTSGNHPQNTGAYTITGINSGKAVLDLRSLSAVLSTQNGAVDGLNWRMVDVNKWASQAGDYRYTNNWVEVYCGFGLESPHSSKWRFVHRGMYTNNDSSQNNGCVQWSAPEDTDLNIDTGDFYKFLGPSIQGQGTGRNKTFQDLNISAVANMWNSGIPDSVGSNMNWMRGEATAGTYTCRVTMMFDDTGKWFFVFSDPTTGGDQPTAGLFGLVGEDTYHPGIQAHCHLTPRDETLTGGVSRNFLSYATGTYRWDYHGKGILPNGNPTRIGTGQFGYGTAHDYIWEQSNAQANPFSGDEWIQPLFLIRGTQNELGWSEREAEGIYQARANLADFTILGTVDGAGDDIAFAANICTLTDAAGLFTADMDQMEISISGSGSGNDGTFTLTYISATQVSWTNAGGATENPFNGTWSVNVATHLHLNNGLVIDWMGERLV